MKTIVITLFILTYVIMLTLPKYRQMCGGRRSGCNGNFRGCHPIGSRKRHRLECNYDACRHNGHRLFVYRIKNACHGAGYAGKQT